MRANLDLPEFRSEVRAWIAKTAPRGLADIFDWRAPQLNGNRGQARREMLRHPMYLDWERRSIESGVVCVSWAREYGGLGWSRMMRAVFEAELHEHGVPKIDRGLGESLVGPSVIAWGTDEQKLRLLPPIISGEHIYCQGFSEPDNGSDLAGLRTRGVVEGEEVVITGQKVWTTYAMEANRIFVLCRTDPDLPRHKGLSYVLAPFNADNHIDVRPLRQISGPAEFAEVFLDGARASLDDVIGGLNNGWRVAMTTLTEERDFNLPTLALQNLHEFWQLVETARARGVIDDPVVRQRLAEAYSKVSIMRFLGDRLLSDPSGAQTGGAVAIVKLFWSEYHGWLADLAMTIDGAEALVRPAGPGYSTSPWQDTLLAVQAETILAGTSDIQRNLISERVLNLPR